MNWLIPFFIRDFLNFLIWPINILLWWHAAYWNFVPDLMSYAAFGIFYFWLFIISSSLWIFALVFGTFFLVIAVVFISVSAAILFIVGSIGGIFQLFVIIIGAVIANLALGNWGTTTAA